MSDKAFKSVWDAIEDDPAQAANMKHRSALPSRSRASPT
jgi:predicted XRE-type DNA-binding protein